MLLALLSKITSGSGSGPYEVLEIELRSATCKAGTLLLLYSLSQQV